EHAGRPFEPKPAYYAARTLTSLLAEYSFVARLTTPSNEDYVLTFRNGNEFRVAAWTTARVTHDVNIPMAVGSYNAIDYLGKEVRTLRSVKGFLTISLSNTPVYIKKNQQGN